MDIQTLIAELNARRQQQAPKNPIQTLLDQARDKAQGADKGKDGDAATDPRTVRDTVTLSDGGQKIVNLARGFELANEFRTKPVDKGFFSSLGRALGDVFRIGRLFLGTIKAAFAQSRK
jgi:hypothetical protein